MAAETLETRTLLTVTTGFAGGVLTFDGDGADDTIVIESTATPGEVNFDDGTGFGSQTQTGVNSIVFNGNGGDDSFVVSMATGELYRPAVGTTFNITYAAGGQTVTDSMVLGGGSATFIETYTPGAVGAGNLTFVDGGNTLSVNFSNLESLDDAADAGTFTANINGAPDVINVVDGPLLTPVASFVQGPIVVDGGDRDDHGSFSGGANQDGWKFMEQMLNYSLSEAFNPAATKDLLVIGANSGQALAAINSVVGAAGLNLASVDFITSVVDIQNRDLTQYNAFFVPSDSGNTSGGITQAQVDALATRTTDITDFVRAGGGVVALTEAATTNAFSWLAIPDAFVIAASFQTIQRQTTFLATAFADAGLGITNTELSNGTPTHNQFIGPVGFNGLDPWVVFPGGDNLVDAANGGEFSPNPQDPNGTVVNGTGGDQINVLGQGAINETIGGGQALQINDGGTNSFTTINLAQKVNVVVNAGGGNDVITVNLTDALKADGLTGLTINGEANNDTINVRALPADVPTQIFGGTGNDTINIFDTSNTVNNILSRMMIDGGTGTDTVFVNDSGSNPAGNDGETVDISITGGVPAIEGIFGAGSAVSVMGTDILLSDATGTVQGSVEILTVSTSADNDDINVDMNGVTATDLTTITINGSGGSDLFNIQSDTPSDATTNLNGNAGADQFFFETGQFVLTGALNGGSGNDVLDYSAYGSGRTIQLTALGSTDGFQGNDATAGGASIAPVAGNSFDNIDILIGSSQDDTLIGANLRNHFDLGGDIAAFDDAHFGPTGGARTDGGLQLVNSLTDAGVLVADEADLSLPGNAASIGRPTGANPIAPNAAGEQDLAFTSFQFFVGALTQDDRFDLRDQAIITGTIDGRGGNDTIDYRDYSTTVAVDLNTGTATNVFAGAAGGLIASGASPDDNSIENAFGGDADDMIFGDDDDNILGDGFGNDLLIGDRAREGVDPTGVTSGNDTFRLEPRAGDDDVVYDIAGNDTVDFRFATQGIVYDADIVGIQDVFNAGTMANVDLRLHDTLVAGIIPQPATGNTPFENVVGSQFNDIIDIDPLSISGNFPTDIPVNRFVDGNSPVVGDAGVPPGDILKFDAKGSVVQDTGLSLTAQGVGTVAYRSIETITSFDDAPRFIDDGDDFVATFPNTVITTNNNAKWITVLDSGFGNDFLYSTGPGLLGTDTPNTVTWTSNGVATGLYRISMTWPDRGPEFNVSSSVPVQVFDGDTLLATLSINQRLAPSGLLDEGAFWQQLGIFNFQSHTARIVLSNETDGAVFADAIRIEQISPNPELRVELQDTGEYITDGVDIVNVTSVIEQPQTRTFTITNEGTAPLSITDIELEQGTGTNWSLTTPDGTAFVLAPGQSSFVTVTLLATTANGQADFPAELRIFSNDADENVLQQPGQGVNPNPDADPLNDVNPFTIPLNGVVSTVDIIDDGDLRFSLVGTWSQSGTSAAEQLAFNGDSVATANDGSGDRAIWTFSNLPDGRYRVSTSWQDDPILTLTTAEYQVLDSATVRATVQIDQSVAPNDLNANGVTYEDLGTFDIVGGIIVVELRDTKIGTLDTIVVADSVRIERQFDMVPDVTLFDGGVGGTEIADDTGVVSFGTVLPGAQVQKTFTVRNDGTQDLTVREPIRLPAAYTLISFNGLPPTNDTEITLTPGQTLTFVVQLNASTVGQISGEMSFATGELAGGANADPDENPVNVTLTANIQSTVIIDNQDATGFTPTAGFVLFNGYQGYNTEVHLESSGNLSGDTATWTFQVDPGSTYRIGTTYTTLETRATNAPYTVSGIVGGDQVIPINQRLAPDDRIANGSAFEDLGVFVAAGNTITVSLSDLGNGNVVADAVRLEALFGPEIEVRDNTSGLNLQNTTSSVDFGDTTQGGAALTRTFTITNDGQRDLALGPINLPTNYQLVGAFPISIAANGGTGTFTVQLTTADAGTYGGVLSFANDDADEGFFNFAITGIVVGAAPTIIDNVDGGFNSVGAFTLFTGAGHNNSFEASEAGTGAGVATWSFTGLAAGIYNVATTWTAFFNRTTAAPYTVTDSTGTTSYTINQVAAPDDFADMGTTWENLVGAFVVDGTGTLTVTLSDLASGYVDADAVRIELIGNQPEIVVTDLGANQAAGGGDDANVSDGGTFNFGATTPGTAVVQTFSIANPGTAPLTIGQLTLPTGFTTTYTPQTIAASGSATFTITYDGIVDATGTFQFLTNDDDENPFNFTVTGTAAPGITIIDDNGDGGASPNFAVTAGFAGFTTQSFEGFQSDIRQATGDSSGDTATWTFAGLTAGGTYRVSSTWFAFFNRATDAPYTISGIDGGPLTIDVNQQVTPSSFRENGEDWFNLETVRADAGGTITVTLSDTANGIVVADAVRVEQVVGNNPEIIVHEGGQVIADGSSVSFGTVAQGGTLSRTFTVVNSGQTNLTVQTPVLPTGFTTPFTTTAIAPGSTADIVVSVTTTSSAVFSGVMSFSSNDGDESPFNLSLSATVAAPTPTIIDNGDAGFTPTVGFSSFGGQGFQNDVHFAAGDASGDTATYAFTGLADGQYLVSTTWTAHSSRATDAPYTVNGGAAIDINQQAAPDDFIADGVAWEKLGVFTVSGGAGTITVVLGDDANQFVIADAVRVDPIVGAEITVLNGTTVINQGGTLNFGSVVQATANVTRTITVRNDGPDNLILQPITAPAGFTISSGNFTPNQIVTSGTSVMFDIQIDTSAAATLTGVVEFGNNDADESPFNFTVTGIVTSNAVQIIDDGDAVGYSTTDFVKFNNQGFQGDVDADATPGTGSTSTWTFSNLVMGGTYRVSTTWTAFPNRATDSPYTISGINGGPVTIDINQEVAPDDFTDQGTAFEDLGTFVLTGTTLTVSLSDDANEGVIADAVRIERITMQVFDGGTEIADGDSSVDFGSVSVGGTFSKVFTVNNVGSTPLTVQPVTVPAGFTVVNDFTVNQVIPSGMSATFEVGVNSAAPGTFTGTVQFTNDSSLNPFDFAVSVLVGTPAPKIVDDGDATYSSTGGFMSFTGQGFQNDVRFAAGDGSGDTATWTFGNLQPGTYRVSATWTPSSNRATDAPYSINGGAAIDINQELAPNDASFTSVQDSGSGIFFADLAGGFVHAGGNLTVTLGDDADEFVIADAIRVERLVGAEVELLAGTTSLPDGTGSFDFGNTLVGGTATQVFTVNNVGVAPLTVQPVSLPAGFSFVSNLGAGQVIGAGASATFEVSVNSGTPGSFSGTLQFANDDADENPFNITITATVGADPALIIDNGQTGFASTGFNLYTAANLGQFNNNSHFTAGDNTGDFATWTFTGLAAGTYRISTTWYEHPNRATDAPFSINGGAAIDINQELDPSDGSFTSIVDSGSGLVFADIDGAYVHAGGDLVITLTDDADEFIIADAIRVQRLSPLQAAAGESATAAVANLNQGDVTEVFQTAVAIWTATGLTSEQSELLAAVTFDVRDLADGHLGAASTSAIFLDINGAGYGWFVDSTPLVNEEFQFVDGSLSAIPGGPADGQIDLLTVVLHELGHVIGLGDLPSASAAGNLMSENISTSLRRLPAGTGSSTSSSLPAAQPPISSSSDNSTAAGLNGLLETPLVGHHTPAELYADRQDDDVLEPGTQPANTRLSDDEADGIDTVFSFLTQENNQNNQSPFDQI